MRKSGWKTAGRRRVAGKMLELDIVPSAWDVLLASKQCSEDEAIRKPDVRDWIRSNFRRRFIPERVLDELGIKQEQCV